MSPNDKTMCPSAPASKGALLLGVVNSTGKLSYLEEQLPIDKHFITAAEKGRTVSKRFRFANKCAAKGCQNWNGEKCTVPDTINRLAKLTEEPTGLPKCSIRTQCRWYMQDKEKACRICPYIRTEHMV